jgi:hypothetical protein
MKTKMSKQILFLAALGCMAAPVAAQTVDVSINCGQSYTINSTVDASAGGATITYQWLENGSKVTGTAASYTVPATKSVGLYTYIRQAMTTGCPDWQSSNAFTVEVKNTHVDGVCLGGVMWAKYNVDEPGSFTYDPNATGKYYQFNSKDPVPSSDPDMWPAYVDPGIDIWDETLDPCPEGWHLPSVTEAAILCSPEIGYLQYANGGVPYKTHVMRCSTRECSVDAPTLNHYIVFPINSGRLPTGGYAYSTFRTQDHTIMLQPHMINTGCTPWGDPKYALSIRCVK